MIHLPAAPDPAAPVRAVGIGEVGIDMAPTTLAAFGLGSCVGLAAWDPVTRVGGLAHFMLPSGVGGGTADPAKYVDTGLPWFLGALAAAGAEMRLLQFKAAGGAAMFLGISASLQVGQRNISALGMALATAGLMLAAQDLGGAVGRTVRLDLTTGGLSVRTIHGTSVL